jgi:hypothetical protein
MTSQAFASALDDLGTTPDRAKIDVLGMVAEDAVGDAALVQQLANIFLARLAAAAPARKLAMLYALDYISKKKALSRSFQAAFAPSLVRAFTEAYGAVRRLGWGVGLSGERGGGGRGERGGAAFASPLAFNSSLRLTPRSPSFPHALPLPLILS